MNCEQIQERLVSYLHHETTPSERVLVHAHLSECAACQKELALLSHTQDQVSSVLQRRAAHVSSPSDAWDRLEARLAQEAQPAPSKFRTWLSRLAPGASHRAQSTQPFFGGVTMNKQTLLASGLACLAIALVAIVVFNSVTPVSASQILNRAHQAESQEVPVQGIQHIRTVSYENLEARSEDQGTSVTLESYLDLETGNFRMTITDNKTDKVFYIHAYDGSNLYSQDGGK
jgi:anti-sigma factor RsiW